MIRRYQTEMMKALFSDEFKLRTWFRVEIAYLEAYFEKSGQLNEELIFRLKRKLDEIDWTDFVAKVLAFEKETQHDVIAFLYALEEELKEDARFIHLGLTSSDIVDTAWALILKEAGSEVLKKLEDVIYALFKRAQDFKGVLCLGRTHGQAAEPTTFGIKLLSLTCEFLRSHERVKTALTGLSFGKLSGAVGVYAQTDPMVEKNALKKLGLSPETVSTQVIARDRHAAFFASLATLGGSIERLSVEIRLLMHGEVQEVYEPFKKNQKGSSAMPHKRNPILSENLTGLMRLIRSYALAAFENQALWHERDISHSSVERVIGPDALSVMDFALGRATKLINGLSIDQERMAKNLEKISLVLCSQTVMIALIEKGLMRQEAYDLVQKASMQSDKNFAKNLQKAGIGDYLSEEEQKNALSSKLKVREENLFFDRVQELIAATLKPGLE